MRLERIHIKGFRNFNDAEIEFQKKTLIIGANDVGKSNLLYALRILFDKTISEYGMELTESDYNAYSKTDTIEITVTLCDVTEECLISEFVGSLKDGRVVIRYTNQKGGSYKIFTGHDDSTLEEIHGRKYIKRLNMQYVDTNRDLVTFMARERSRMLQMAKERRSVQEAELDEQKIDEIQEELDGINNNIGSLKYITQALDLVNKELGELSAHNEDQLVQFVAGESDVEGMLNNLTLAYSTDATPLAIGGDGRNNQIFLATWIAKQRLQESMDHVTFYAIEEPEAHLHPHQQRKLSAYILDSFDSQILVTTHSPHIAARFDPACVVRLFMRNKYSMAACGGCSKAIESVFNDFGYRLNALSAEVFFSDGIFLVEGISEVLFYTALAAELRLDLDRYNISILSVEGVGFKPYVAVCDALKIPWVLRTDNDIFSKSNQGIDINYFAGITRVIGIIREIADNNSELLQYWDEHSLDNEWCSQDIPDIAKELNENIRIKANELGIFLSNVDLETDLANSKLKDALFDYYNTKDTKKLIGVMQRKKAENMLGFLTVCHDKLSLIDSGDILSPLKTLIDMTVERTMPDNDKGAN